MEIRLFLSHILITLKGGKSLKALSPFRYIIMAI